MCSSISLDLYKMPETRKIEYKYNNRMHESWEMRSCCPSAVCMLKLAYNFAIMLLPPVLNLFCSQVEMSAPSRSLFIEPCR